MLMLTPARLRVPQLVLFQPPLIITPALPPEVYRKTVQVLARLLREYVQQAGPTCSGREVGHE
jgi:hypothetical protein